MTTVSIKLTWAEILLAANVGVMRNVQSQRDRRTPSALMGFADTWTPNIEGAAGEMAVAKHLGIYWTGMGAIGDIKADDVGPYQVRTNMSRRLTDMILRPNDDPKKLYVSVLSFLPEFTILGYIKGEAGKRPEYLRNGSADRPPCYFVPQEALHPIDEISWPA